MDAINIFSNKGGTADPLVKVEVLGKKKLSRPKKKTLSPIFNQTFFFSFENLKKEILEEATLKFTVLDKTSLIMKNSVLGYYEIDFSTIYFSLHHEIYQGWLTLTDPTDEREGIMV